eukprot:TRINITY_DN1669_c0_g1_i1.p1 TRINITY_DN1669_c0_g1~~TRINITY_DN1669_c0_g1_i1.p1  ORF type:complete len:210 (-),score=65.02 TRINITY_DN1669_c0_g1_i1:46-675(-)
MAVSIFDLPSQISYYAAYHNNTVNKLIHLVFVPTILWTALVLLCYSGPLFDIPFVRNLLAGSALSPYVVFNFSFLLVCFYSVYFIILEPFAGVTFSVVLYLFWLSATYFQLTTPDAWQPALVANVVAWIAQFIGHGVFEGRRPTLIDNLVQALLLAPYFVWFEVLFFFGYRPELQKQVEKFIESRIVEWKKQGNKGGKTEKSSGGKKSK